MFFFVFKRLYLLILSLSRFVFFLLEVFLVFFNFLGEPVANRVKNIVGVLLNVLSSFLSVICNVFLEFFDVTLPVFIVNVLFDLLDVTLLGVDVFLKFCNFKIDLLLHLLSSLLNSSLDLFFINVVLDLIKLGADFLSDLIDFFVNVLLVDLVLNLLDLG